VIKIVNPNCKNKPINKASVRFRKGLNIKTCNAGPYSMYFKGFWGKRLYWTLWVRWSSTEACLLTVTNDISTKSLEAIWFRKGVLFDYEMVQLIELEQRILWHWINLRFKNWKQAIKREQWKWYLCLVLLLQSISQIWAIQISLWWFGFMLKPIFSTAPAAPKNDAQFKRGQNWLKNKQLALLI